MTTIDELFKTGKLILDANRAECELLAKKDAERKAADRTRLKNWLVFALGEIGTTVVDNDSLDITRGFIKTIALKPFGNVRILLDVSHEMDGSFKVREYTNRYTFHVESKFIKRESSPVIETTMYEVTNSLPVAVALARAGEDEYRSLQKQLNEAKPVDPECIFGADAGNIPAAEPVTVTILNPTTART